MRHCRESRVGRTAERGTCDAVQREGCMTLCRERGGTYCQERHCRNRGGTLQREGWDTAEREEWATTEKEWDTAEKEEWDTTESRRLQRESSGTLIAHVAQSTKKIARFTAIKKHNIAQILNFLCKSLRLLRTICKEDFVQ